MGPWERIREEIGWQRRSWLPLLTPWMGRSGPCWICVVWILTRPRFEMKATRFQVGTSLAAKAWRIYRWLVATQGYNVSFADDQIRDTVPTFKVSLRRTTTTSWSRESHSTASLRSLELPHRTLWAIGVCVAIIYKPPLAKSICRL